MNLRQEREAWEDKYLSPYAARSADGKGRLKPEDECDLRPAYQHDRDRILYSKAFRRLKHKTQVFLSPSGDHYRTRLTHTLEVSQIARTMARALNLNEDLTEAIALGHDLGHTPFGHAGEAILNEIMPQGFRHHEQSLRVVDILEKSGQGLNLTYEVRMGILQHSKGKGRFLPDPERDRHMTMEAQCVRVADVMAYIAHDTDDATRGGVIFRKALPDAVKDLLGDRLSRQIDTMIRDCIAQTKRTGSGMLCMSAELVDAMWLWRDFLYENVYDNMKVHGDFVKASKVMRELFDKLLIDDEFFLAHTGHAPEPEGREQAACDYLAGMTDRYALSIYQETFMPRPWAVM